MSAELDYGNARLRARLARRIDGATYEKLARLSPDALLTALAETPYREAAQTAGLRYRGARGVFEAVRLHLGASLGSMRAFYEGRAKSQVELLLGRYDHQNLRAVLRAQIRRAPRSEVEPLLVPAGTIEESVLLDLASREGLRACIDRMLAWRVPAAPIAAALASALAEGGKGTTSIQIESALARGFAEQIQSAVKEGYVEPDLAWILASEIDRDNLLVALRLQGAGARHERLENLGPEVFVPGGRLSREALWSAIGRASRAEALAALSNEPIPGAFRAPLDAWVREGSLPSLAGALAEALAEHALSRLRSGDPLSVAVPIAYVYAKEVEARKLRLIAAAAFSPHPVLIDARERSLALRSGLSTS